MKRLLALFFILFILGSIFAQTIRISSKDNAITLLDNEETQLSIQYQVGEVVGTSIQTKAGRFTKLSVQGFNETKRIGEPILPLSRKLISVPLGASVSVELEQGNKEKYLLTQRGISSPLMPAQPSLAKNMDPSQVEFIYHEDFYKQNKWTDNPTVSVEEIGIMRGVRIFAVNFEPIKYNPVTREIEVYSEATVRVRFANGNTSDTNELRLKTYSPIFEQTYAGSLFNYRSLPVSLVKYPIKMLIISDPMFASTLQPFVEWKTKEGYKVIVKYTNDAAVGTTTSSIKSYLSTVYNAGTTADPAPTYVIFVGDTGQIPIWSASVTTPASDHYTDLTYAKITGSDYLPEFYYARFSANSVAELQPQIDKTLYHEMFSMSDTSYMDDVVMIAGQDPTYGPKYGDAQINYGTTNYFNSTHGLTSHTYLYAVSGSSDAAIIGNVNSGTSYVNYTAHGSSDGWADPTFSVSDVASLTNTGKYPLMVGNCCLSNKFDVTTCFGEALLRASNKGAVAYIGGTNSTYWDEDFWWGVGSEAAPTTNNSTPTLVSSKVGAYDAMFHEHGEPFSAWHTTVGQMVGAGNLAVVEAGSSYANYYWEIYSVDGDPSLTPYIGIPTAHTATYPSTILIGATSVSISAQPYSYVCISQNGVIYGVGLVPESGSLTMTLTPFTSTGTANIVITKQGKKPVISTITIAPNNGPYLSLQNQSTDVVAEAGRNLQLSYAVKNIGTVASGSVTATLSTTSSAVAFNDNTDSITSLSSSTEVTRTNAFSFTLANNIADQTAVPFRITFSNGSDNWYNDFSITVNSPVLSLGNASIIDTNGNGNSILDPGETGIYRVTVSNTGHATSTTGTITVSCPLSGIVFLSATQSIASIAVAGISTVDFTVTAGSAVSIGTTTAFTTLLTAGGFTASKTDNVVIGKNTSIIGTGTITDQALPIEPFYGYSLSQSIYLSSEINFGAAPIQKIAYYYSGTSWTDAITIYMGHTTKTAFSSSSDWVASSNLTQVYSGSLTTTTSSGWVELTLSTPFSYNGNSNLVVAVDENTSGYHASADEFYCSAVTGNRSIVFYDDNTNPSPSSPPTSGTYLYTKAYIPNTRLTFGTPTQYQSPQNLTGTAGNNSVSLTWVAPQSGTPIGYNVYRNATVLTTSTITSLNYTDTMVNNGTSYSYYVTAIYSGSHESSASNTVNVTPIAPVYNPPTSLTAIVGDTQVMLSWASPSSKIDYVSSRGIKVLSGYKVYRNGTAITSNVITGTSYTDTNVTNGTSYTYYITAIYSNPVGESSASNSVIAVPNVNSTSYPWSENFDSVTAPALPTGWTALNVNSDDNTWITSTNLPNTSPNSLQIHWNATASMNDWIFTPKLSMTAGLTYSVSFKYRAAGATFPEKLELKWGSIPSVAGMTSSAIFNNSSITNTSYTTGTGTIIPQTSGEYYLGFHGYSDQDMYYLYIDDVSVAVSGSVYYPPTSLTGVAGNGSVSLTWLNPVLGSPTGYRLYRNSALLTTLASSAMNYTDSAVSNGTSYTYYVTAVYSANESSASNTVIIVPTPGDNVPAGAIAISLPIVSTMYEISSDSDVDWYKFSLSNGDSVRVYTTKPVGSNVDPEMWLYGPSNSDGSGIVPTTYLMNDNNSYGDSQPQLSVKVINTGTYFLRVAASSNDPTSVGKRKFIQKFTKALTGQYNLIIEYTAAPVYNPPQTLTALADNNVVNLSWAAPTVSIPNQYRVYRGGVIIATLSSSVLAYNDNSVTNNTSYTYYVTALYGSLESVSSNSVTITPSVSQVITIGTGSGTSYQRQPFGIYFGYERSVSIYKANEINASGTVQKLSWNVAQSSTNAVPVKIYMKTTTTSSHTASTWASISTDANLVYQGNIIFSTTGWNTITLNTPFSYGSNNLMVLIEANYGGDGVSSYPRFYYSSSTGTHETWATDNNPPTTTGTVNAYRPDIKLTIGNVPTTPVFSVTPATYNYGNVEVSTTTAYQSFVISNSGGGVLQINTPMSLSCAAGGEFEMLDNNTYPLVLSAGQSASVSVRMLPQSSGARVCTLNIIEGSNTSHTINLTGTAYDPAVSIPWNEDFRSAVPPTNWKRLSGVLNSNSSTVTTTSGWANDGFINNGTSGSARLTIYGTACTSWLVTPPIVLSGANYTLEFDLGLTKYNLTDASVLGTDDKFAVVLSTDNGTTWTNANILRQWSSTTAISNTGEHISLSVSGVNGRVKFAFYGESTVANADNDLFIDNVSFQEILSNHAPVLHLVSSLSFPRTQSYAYDMGNLIIDPEGDAVTITARSSSHIQATLNGTMLTLTGKGNWFGTETITVIASDTSNAADSSHILVTLSKVNSPSWSPVVYPNNSATIYGIVTVDGEPAALGDNVGLFVGSECRGVGNVVMNNGIAYTTILANVNQSGEAASFKIYRSLIDEISSVDNTISLTIGATYGQYPNNMFSINGTTLLDTPSNVNIFVANGQIVLNWGDVMNATGYKIFGSNNIGSGYTLISTTNSTTYRVTITDNSPRFFYIVSLKDQVVKVK